GTTSAMSTNCRSSAIANWPISALIARTFRALQPAPITADLFLLTDERITPASLRALSYVPWRRRRIPLRPETRYLCDHDRHPSHFRNRKYRGRGSCRLGSRLAGRQV